MIAIIDFWILMNLLTFESVWKRAWGLSNKIKMIDRHTPKINAHEKVPLREYAKVGKECQNSESLYHSNFIFCLDLFVRVERYKMHRTKEKPRFRTIFSLVFASIFTWILFRFWNYSRVPSKCSQMVPKLSKCQKEFIKMRDWTKRCGSNMQDV